MNDYDALDEFPSNCLSLSRIAMLAEEPQPARALSSEQNAIVPSRVKTFV